MRSGSIRIPQPNSGDPCAGGGCGTRHPRLPLPTGAIPRSGQSRRRTSPRQGGCWGGVGVTPFAPQPTAGWVPPHPQGSSKPPSPCDGAPPGAAARCILLPLHFPFLRASSLRSPGFCRRHSPGAFRGHRFLQPCWDTCSSLAQRPAGCGPLCQAGAPPAPAPCRSIPEPPGPLQAAAAAGAGTAGDVQPAQRSLAWLPPQRWGFGGWSWVPSPPQSSPVLPSLPWCGTGGVEECEGRATPAKCSAPELQPPSRSEQRP